MIFFPELVHPLDSRISLETDLAELDFVFILDSLTPIEFCWNDITISEYGFVTSYSQRE